MAIKRLLGNWYHDAEMVSRFREEIVLMSNLDHPNGMIAHCRECMLTCSPLGVCGASASLRWRSVGCRGRQHVVRRVWLKSGGGRAVLDAFRASLVTELCESNLEELLHSSTQLDWHHRISLALDIARGSAWLCVCVWMVLGVLASLTFVAVPVSYLHIRAGIIQRDLKTCAPLAPAFPSWCPCLTRVVCVAPTAPTFWLTLTSTPRSLISA